MQVMVTHLERNVARIQEVNTMSGYLGDRWLDNPDPFHATLFNHIRILRIYLGDSRLDDVFDVTSSRHQSDQTRWGCFGNDRETTSCIVYNSGHSLIQLQGLHVVCKSLVKRAEE